MILPFGDFTHWPGQMVMQISRFVASRFGDGFAEAAAQRYINAVGRGNFLPELWYDVFEFIGYDLVDKDSSISALTNCGGFPKAFSNGELSEKGLFRTHERSREVQEALRQQYPTEHHADCHLWAIFRCQ